MFSADEGVRLRPILGSQVAEVDMATQEAIFAYIIHFT